jgi:DHA2 family multidrug resistance protein
MPPARDGKWHNRVRRHVGTMLQMRNSRDRNSGSWHRAEDPMDHAYPPPATRRLITLFGLSAAFMTQLDATIANVALPHMQASTMASREQISWVLTSYIIMSAIFTPLSGWLADRFGRKWVMVCSVSGFTGASVLCGLANSLDQLIAFRLLQGALGAALLPMSQAILLDINPPEKHGSAMALWGFGAVVGPVVGPLLGGWLTENFNWRWVFFINVPFGIFAAIGLLTSMPEPINKSLRKFDFLGFGSLAIAIGMFQLVLDRGQLQDWFNSTEICIEAGICATALYLFLTHSLTAERPFINLAIFRDRNFAIGSVLGFFLGGLMYGVLALLPPLLSELMGYPVELIGLVTAPRGVGTMIAMLVVGRLSGKVDDRILIVIGLALCGWSTVLLSQVNLQMDSWLTLLSGFVQGVGGGVLFVPVTTVVFATISPKLRNEGAAVNSLIRGLSGSVWIAVLQTVTTRSSAVVQSRLVESVRPDNPMLQRMWGFDMNVPQSVARMEAEIGRQALMVSYANAFWLLTLAAMVVAPLVLLIKPAKQRAKADPGNGGAHL